MSQILDNNISFSDLKAAYVAGGGTGADGNSSLRDEKTNTKISLSFFRNAGFTNGTTVPSGTDEISIKDDFKSKTFGSSNVTNHIRMKYHRYGATFNHSFTPSGKSTLDEGTFVLYFWNTSDNSLTRLGTRIKDQQHTSTTSSYSTITYDITQPENTSGYLLFILYGWNHFRADMAIGYVVHQYDDNTTKQILYTPSSSVTTAKSGQDWRKTTRQDELVTSYSSTTVSDIEDEIASKSQSDTWSTLSSGTSFSGGWQMDRYGTTSTSTGASRGSNGSSSSYYIYCETSGQNKQTVIAYSALRVPITIADNSGGV